MARLRSANPGGSQSRVMNVQGLPMGSCLVMKDDTVEALGQERLMLSACDARRFSRVWGVVKSLKGESSSSNAKTPASGQVLLKLDWMDTSLECLRNFFARAAIYSADFAPRYADGRPSNIHVGDIVNGMLATPSSDRQSTTITGRGHGRLDEFHVQLEQVKSEGFILPNLSAYGNSLLRIPPWKRPTTMPPMIPSVVFRSSVVVISGGLLAFPHRSSWIHLWFRLERCVKLALELAPWPLHRPKSK